MYSETPPWASCQVHKIAGCACAGNAGTFSPAPRVSYPDTHHGTCVTHVPRYMPGSLISGFLWSRWRGKRSWHSRRMRNPQFYVSGKRPMAMASVIDMKTQPGRWYGSLYIIVSAHVFVLLNLVLVIHDWFQVCVQPVRDGVFCNDLMHFVNNAT